MFGLLQGQKTVVAIRTFALLTVAVAGVFLIAYIMLATR
jgi:hypothetical protein